MWKLGKITAKTHIGDYGQIVDSFVLLLKDTCCEEVKMTNGTDFILEKNYNDLTGKVNAKGVTEISICETEEGTEVELILDPFVYRYDFKVTGTIAGTEVSFTRADVDKVWIKDMDQFVAYEENGVHYRMYEPECMGKRPLVLFLHGGGECGEDNELQLTGTLGALRLAERWSDMYIMAPQAPSGNLGMQEMFEVMKKRGNPFSADMGITPFSLKGERGWNRDYVAKVTDIIRKMISDGKPCLSYRHEYGRRRCASDNFSGTGLICGGGTDLSEHEWRKLCKSSSFTESSGMDHICLYGSPAQQTCVYSQCMQQAVAGRTDVKFTLYTQEELAKYGIGTTEGLTSQELDAENHNSWILALHNENGILDWMISHQKNKEKC